MVKKNKNDSLLGKNKLSFVILMMCFSLLVLSIASSGVLAVTSTTDNVENVSIDYSDSYLSAQSLYDELVADTADLEELNLSTIRYSDVLLIAESELSRAALQEETYFLATAEEKESLSLPDYTSLFERLEEISSLKYLALQTHDEFIVLQDFLNENNYLEDNATAEKFRLANESFHAERYEEAMVHIESARESASEYDALNTKVKALVAASSRNIKSFLQTNWEWVLMGFAIFLTLFFVLKKIIRRAIVQRKLSNLQLRKDSIHELTKQIQRDSFSTGKLSESAYHIRLKVYGEMVRDIRRQIPLLEEELALQKNFFGKRKSTKTARKHSKRHSKHVSSHKS